MRERTTYTKAFKLKVVHELKTGLDEYGNKIRPRDIWKRYHMDRQRGYEWLHDYERYGEWAFEERNVLLKEIARCHTMLKESDVLN